MTNEERLHRAMSEVIPSFHTVLDGQPDAAGVYRLSGKRRTFESNVCIMTVERFQIYIYQKQYSELRVHAVIGALEAAGFTLESFGAQYVEEIYYRDEINVWRLKEEDDPADGT